MPEIIDRETTRPPYGAMFATDAIMRANRETGGHYFDADTMRFFDSRVLDGTYGGRFFITSERSGFDRSSPRFYTVREFMPDGSIETVGDFNGHGTSGAARRAARELAKGTHSYYFSGRHGRRGREASYIVAGAVDPWHAMARLSKDFRIAFMGRAEGTQFESPHYIRLQAR
jgi:hypothetical protein